MPKISGICTYLCVFVFVFGFVFFFFKKIKEGQDMTESIGAQFCLLDDAHLSAAIPLHLLKKYY